MGSSFLGGLYVYTDHRSPEQPFALPGYIELKGWWIDDNTVYTPRGEIYDLQGNLLGQISDTFPQEMISVSGTGLVLIRVGKHIWLCTREGERLASLWTRDKFRVKWSPSGRQALLIEGSLVISPEGPVWLDLPVGSSPVGWLDEDRLLVRRDLGFPECWYVYTLADGKIEYIQIPDPGEYSDEQAPRMLSPAGDGQRIAWQQGRQILFGKLERIN